jgi:NAD-dependent dihydropyrimidine dehydrogenase PreA subunit
METVFKDYLGIPRKLIPWFPSIDGAKCKGCSTCVKACKHEVFALDSSRKKAFVANPYCCEVFCQSCQFQCNEEAISFPDKGQVKEAIRKLRDQYPPK